MIVFMNFTIFYSRKQIVFDKISHSAMLFNVYFAILVEKLKYISTIIIAKDCQYVTLQIRNVHDVI